MSNFWSLDGLPSYWRKKWFWALLAFGVVLSTWTHSKYAPAKNPPGHVIVYQTAWCPYCEAARAHLTASNIPFTAYNIESSFDGWIGSSVAMKGKVRAVPIILVGPTVISGYQRGILDDNLRAAGYNPEGKPGMEGSSDPSTR